MTLGLFDMLGNAFEWCQNLPFLYPSDRPLVEDSEQTGEVRDSESRVLRGGSFYSYAANVRSANRDFTRPVYRFSNSRFSRGQDLQLVSLTSLPLASSGNSVFSSEALCRRRRRAKTSAEPAVCASLIKGYIDGQA